MSLEFYSEHVVALSLQPIRRFPDRPYARNLERPGLRDLGFYSRKTAVRKRAKMPHDLDRSLEVAVLDGSHVTEIIVALAGIVVQPLHYLEYGTGRYVHNGLTPDHQL